MTSKQKIELALNIAIVALSLVLAAVNYFNGQKTLALIFLAVCAVNSVALYLRIKTASYLAKKQKAIDSEETPLDE